MSPVLEVNMAPMGYKQEMPPSGGYGPVEWAKQPLKKPFSGVTRFGMFIGFTSCAWVVWYFVRRQQRMDELEMRDARIAITPLIQAEQHRLFLKQLRENRDEENELMKDVENWKTGTLWGQPVYHNVRNRFIMPAVEEYYAHCKYWDRMNAVYDNLNH